MPTGASKGGSGGLPGSALRYEERLIAFLASDDASYVSGTGLLADGGYTVA